MTTAQVVESSATVTNKFFQNYTHPDDHTRQTTDTSGFKPFAILSRLFLTSCWLSPVGGAIWGFVGPAVAVIGVCASLMCVLGS